MNEEAPWPPKDVEEDITITWDAAEVLETGETVTPGTITIDVTVEYGVDAAPNAIKSGAPQLVGTEIKQRIIGGLKGVVYHLRCKFGTSAARILVAAKDLRVQRF